MVVTTTDDGGERPAPALRKKERGRSHSEAERKRRQRINAHLATLRTLVPSASRVRSTTSRYVRTDEASAREKMAPESTYGGLALQMDKAALLGEVVRHVRELRAKASEAAEGVGPGVIPGEGDEVGVDVEDRLRPRRVVRAWVCCADRPGLLTDMGRAARSVGNARPVRAEMATVGGRTRGVMELDVCDDDAAEKGRAMALSTLRAVLLNREGDERERFAAAAEGYNKRPRFSAQVAEVQSTTPC
ncbi:hypothetical protein HU200_006579 [Digitaria exilis]|uniref:BHLH domain-containing protein n=1 Tax=Digitaria exilis TaxID=1010633 RepID=A0A835FSI5_9POAL|nr:hypothetical protein HU200_006579 [Digitaria exilis]